MTEAVQQPHPIGRRRAASELELSEAHSGERLAGMLRPIDPTVPEIAARIVEIQQSAYTVEAELIGFHGIPQLAETKDQIQALGHMHWVGAFVDDLLVGIIAWEQDGQDVDIDRLAIDPLHARQGFGRRLVRSVPVTGTTSVSTGAANLPAVTLYSQEGFEQVGAVEVAPRVHIAQFQRVT
jgi:GNAT superfamily N-acetyltransferase